MKEEQGLGGWVQDLKSPVTEYRRHVEFPSNLPAIMGRLRQHLFAAIVSVEVRIFLLSLC